LATQREFNTLTQQELFLGALDMRPVRKPKYIDWDWIERFKHLVEIVQIF
jgi:hypothetical protein